MAINFIKNIWNNDVDEVAHAKFVRYGKGEFVKEEFKIKAGSKIQVWAGFEYVEVLFRMMAEVVTEPGSVKGTIVSKQDIKSKFDELGIEPKKITGKKYTVEETLDPEQFKKFVDTFSEYYMLLKAKSGNNEIKTKTSVPKPGKLVEKFASAKFDKSALDMIKKEFLFDHDGNFKEAVINHTYRIDDIIVDESLVEKDPARARLEAKRKGTLIRKSVVDGEEVTEEKDMLV
ncbi:MAG: hypothetical protein ACLFUO_03595 [Candidatus Woesearchaeota archaeon]